MNTENQNQNLENKDIQEALNHFKDNSDRTVLDILANEFKLEKSLFRITIKKAKEIQEAIKKANQEDPTDILACLFEALGQPKTPENLEKIDSLTPGELKKLTQFFQRILAGN